MNKPPPGRPGPGLRWVEIRPDTVDDIVHRMVSDKVHEISADLKAKGETKAQIEEILLRLRPVFAKWRVELKHSLLASTAKPPGH